MINITMQQMISAGVHFGHQTRYWNPKMAPYIFGIRQKIHIINLEKTLPLFKQALEFSRYLAENKGKILFVGTKPAARGIIREEAIRCGMPYVDYRWLGGMLTNYKTIRQSIKRLKELESMVNDSRTIAVMTKKEMLRLVREKDKLSSALEGIKNMGSLPDALWIIDVGHEKTAIREAKRLGIPVLGVVDTNTDPSDIDYVVPGNDDALRAIRFYCKSLADTIIEARGILEIVPEASEEVVEAKIKIIKKVVTKSAQKESSDSSESVEGESDIVDTKKKLASQKNEAMRSDVSGAEKKPRTKSKERASEKRIKTTSGSTVESRINEIAKTEEEQTTDSSEGK